MKGKNFESRKTKKSSLTTHIFIDHCDKQNENIYRKMMPETRKNKVLNPIFVTGMESTMIIMSDKMPKDEDEKKSYR